MAGPAHYGPQPRPICTDDGRLVRRLQAGERTEWPGISPPCPLTDHERLRPIRFAFHRMDTADLSPPRPCPGVGRARDTRAPRRARMDRHRSVARLLRTAAYVGTADGACRSTANYHEAQGDGDCPVRRQAKGHHEVPPEAGGSRYRGHEADEGIIDRYAIRAGASKLAQQPRPARPHTRRDYPLTGLIFCKHCGGTHDRRDHRCRNRQRRLSLHLCQATFVPLRKVWGRSAAQHDLRTLRR